MVSLPFHGEISGIIRLLNKIFIQFQIFLLNEVFRIYSRKGLKDLKIKILFLYKEFSLTEITYYKREN